MLEPNNLLLQTSTHNLARRSQKSEIDAVEWESNPEFNSSGPDFHGMNSLGIDEQFRHTFATETRQLYDMFEHTKEAEAIRADLRIMCEIKELTLRHLYW